VAEFPALPLWTDAYLGDTTHLTTIEHGAYLLLLITAWRTRDCSLPDDDKMLARYARCSPGQWKRLRPILEPFFRVEDGAWMQERLSDERDAVKRFRETQSEKGKKGGKAKSLKYNKRHLAGAESGQAPAVAGAKPDCDLPYSYSTIPLDKESNGQARPAAADLEKDFWDTAKGYLGRTVKNPGALVGKWLRDHGKEETARALTAAQIEHAVEPIAYVEGYFRRHAQDPPEPERPIC